MNFAVDVEGVVTLVTSGGHGRNFVVLLDDRVVNIDENEDELSELDEISVEIIDEVIGVSDEKSMLIDDVEDNWLDMSVESDVEVILLASLSCVDEVS